MGEAVSSKPDPFKLPVTELQGVGPERSLLLAKLGIKTIGDLLLHRPRRYEDRRRFRLISELVIGEQALACGKVVAKGTKWFARHTKSIFEIVLDDGTDRLHCRWWNVNYMDRYFEPGDEVVVCGKLLGAKPRTMDHPETEVVDRGPEGGAHVGRIVPVYPLTEGLSQRWLRSVIWRTLQELPAPETHTRMTLVLGSITPCKTASEANSLPNARTSERGLLEEPRAGIGSLSVFDAIRLMHIPDEPEDGEKARRRLAYEEFLDFQERLQERIKKFQSKARGLPCKGNNRLIRPLLAGLGFTLTSAQKRVLREIRLEMGGAQPMRRLLQGDVGSGKTLVAFCAALMAIESGYSAALMAPTEILAEQHFRTALKWLQPLGVKIHLFTGNRKPDESSTEAGCAVYIGTHALIEPAFKPEKLGLVIIDEQHKFGVSQREGLLRKGHYPHLLVMTATPIPRTLALTMYGDLEASILDELPPGRGNIRTFVRDRSALARVWEFVKSQLKDGRQAYVVFPRVEETAGDVKAVTQEFSKLQSALAPCKVAMLHGRMAAAEKERTMTEFASNRAHVLLATSLVEVGVDVPNASVMVVENAELFGLAQLHQLRGRIGRGSHESYCVLVNNGKDPQSMERLRALEKSNDGFQIAEADLALRGPGEFLGKEQSGAPNFLFADLGKDLDLLKAARTAAQKKRAPA